MCSAVEATWVHKVSCKLFDLPQPLDHLKICNIWHYITCSDVVPISFRYCNTYERFQVSDAQAIFQVSLTTTRGRKCSQYVDHEMRFSQFTQKN